MTPPRRRVWSEAAAIPEGAGWTVTLDGRPIRTPAGAAFRAPGRAVAEEAAAEWAAQGAEIEPFSMPVTRALNTAIDRIAPQEGAVRAELSAYAETDLLCHRAPHPRGLAERQAALWDPPLAWARTRLGATLLCAEGVMRVAQPEESLARLAAAVAARDAFALAALSDLVALSGSLVLGLMVEEGATDWETAWTASRVEEDWQIAQWGEDAEAASVAATKRDAFAAAARLAALLRTPD